MNKSQDEEYFFGTATVGERGQIVIPAEARKEIGILPGDKLLIIKHGPKGLMLLKAETIREFMSMMLERLDSAEKHSDEDPNTESSS